METFEIRPAGKQHAGILLELIKGLADYEKLSHMVVATEKDLEETLFGPRPYAESLIGFLNDEPVGFALFFYNYSTFLGRPGIYLEDLYIRPEFRHRGYGKAFFRYIAALAIEKNCGRFEWSVLDWNTPAIKFYEGMGAVALKEWYMYRLTGDGLRSLAEN
jgi:GNAT superfamily N-acetyltransferase